MLKNMYIYIYIYVYIYTYVLTRIHEGFGSNAAETAAYSRGPQVL